MVLSANTYYQGDSAITAIYQGDVKVWPPVQPGVLIYTSTDNNVITPNVNTGFGANILSNTYSGGQGTILFDGPVTTIPNDAFSGKTTLREIVFADTITTIDANSFSGCTSLGSVNISSGITSVGDFAFCNCTAISSVTLLEGLVTLGAASFYGCTSLSAITIPSTVTSIGINCFNTSLYLNVYYGGLYSQWLNVTQGTDSFAASATIHYRYNSKTLVNYVAYQSFSTSSNQYLNLGISLTTDIKITANCRSAGITTGGILLGCPYNTTENNDFKFFQGSTTGSTFDWGSQRIGGNIGMKIADSGSTLNFTLENYKITNNANSQYRTGTTQTTVPPSGTVIAINTNRWWIKSVSIWKGNTLVLNATAAICDSVAGFYDSITDTFITIPNLRTS